MKCSKIWGPLGLSLSWTNLEYKDNDCAFTNFSELYTYDVPWGAQISIFCKIVLFGNQCAAVLCAVLHRVPVDAAVHTHRQRSNRGTEQGQKIHIYDWIKRNY